MKKICLFLFVFGAINSISNAQLPQDYSYQKTLRSYLGTLQERDFEVKLQPLTAEASYFSSDDEIYRSWLFFGYQNNEMMAPRGLRVDKSHFTLDAIEAGGKVNMTVGKKRFVNAIATAFYADWNYEGNPHFGSRAVKLRAFVAAAVDMMMQDQEHERGKNDRSDFLSLQLIRWSYAYGVAKDELPQDVRNAYENGLIKMFERLEQWGPTGIHADIDVAAMPGVLYAAKFVDSQNLTQRAHQYIDRLLNGYYSDAGYIDHGSAYDAGYNGISAYFVNWAAQISAYPPLVEALKKMSKLKAYMTLPDPDGNEFSPSHSNPSSGTDAPHDLWDPYYRDVGMAEFSDEAAYLVFEGGGKSIYNGSKMLNGMSSSLYYFHDPDRPKAFATPSDEEPDVWEHQHWIDTESLNATAFYYKDGLYDKLKSLKNSNSPLTKPPFARNNTFTESFADKFLSVKRQTYGTIIFNDRLAWWTSEGQTQELNGFGGGNLSAFWTPETGSVLLGGSRGTHSTGHNLDEWQEWPVHALSGETDDGRAFSSGLQRHPEASYNLNGRTKTVTINGDLANIYSDPRDGLRGQAEYRRVFNIKENGVEVTTSVNADGSNSVKQLYEILPVYRRDAYRQSSNTITSIEFKVNGSWQRAGTDLKKVTNIRLSRYNGQVYIDFEKPALVKLNSEDFYKNPDKKSGFQARNIMIDLGTGSLSNQSVRYFMRSSKAAPNDWGESNTEDNKDDNANKDTTAPTFEKLFNNHQEPNETQKFSLNAVAQDAGGIAEITLYFEDKKIKTCTGSERCSVDVGPYSSGAYRYYATATDKAGNKTTSAKKEVNVQPQTEAQDEDSTPPEISLSHTPERPDDTQKVTISVNANDAGGVQQIEIYVNDERVKTCSDSEKCSIQGGPFEKGTYRYHAKATDKAGNKTVSDKKQVEVQSKSEVPDADTTPPEVAISHSPENPDNSQDIRLTAEASDIEGVYEIEIFVDDKKVKACRDTERCIAVLGSYPKGTYRYYAKATDSNGNTKSTAKKQVAVEIEEVEDTTPPEVEARHTPSDPDNSQEVGIIVEADDVSGISQLAIFVEGKQVKTCTDSNSCSVELEPFNDGNYSYYATATDNKGNRETTSKKSFRVKTETEDKTTEGDNRAPEINISHSPSDPYANEIVTFTANSSDDSGLESIKIYVNESLAKVCTNISTCTFKKDSFSPGSYSYYATATDKSSNKNKASTEIKNVEVQEEPVSNKPPQTVNVVLEENDSYLESSVDNVSDPDGDKVNVNYDWRLNGKSIAVINFPFDVKTDPQQKAKVADHTSSGNDGLTGSGNAAPSWTASGRIGGALKFDGTRDFIRVPSKDSQEKLESFTIETWMKHDHWGEKWASIVSKPFSDTKWENPWSVFKLSRNGDNDNLNFQITVGDNEAVSLQSDRDIESGQWTHVVGSYDGEYLKLYINGVLDKELHIGKPLVTDTGTDIFIGQSSDLKNATPEHFKGVLDEFKVFNKVLSSNQIKQHYSGNYKRLSLDLTEDGEQWEVVVTANDSRSRSKATTSNTVTTKKKVLAKSGNVISISQNYPNPFRASTTIEMNLEQEETMTVKIYDSIGRHIRTVFEGKMPAGTNTMEVKGDNLSSGIYFCRFAMESEIITKKMTYIK